MPVLLRFRNGSFEWETAGVLDGTTVTLSLTGPQRNPLYMDEHTPALVSPLEYAACVKGLIPDVISDTAKTVEDLIVLVDGVPV